MLEDRELNNTYGIYNRIYNLDLFNWKVSFFQDAI